MSGAGGNDPAYTSWPMTPPVQVASAKLANENMIQNWIAERPELLELDLLIIGREVVAPDRGRSTC